MDENRNKGAQNGNQRQDPQKKEQGQFGDKGKPSGDKGQFGEHDRNTQGQRGGGEEQKGQNRDRQTAR